MPKTLSDVSPIALAIEGLAAAAKVDFANLRDILIAAYEFARGNTPQQRNIRSAIYHAACRLDELLYFPMN